MVLLEGVVEFKAQITVLGRVRRVDEQPTGQPKVRHHCRQHEEGRDGTTVSGPEEVQERVEDVARSRNEHEDSHPAGEDAPQNDGGTKNTEKDTREDCGLVLRKDDQRVESSSYFDWQARPGIILGRHSPATRQINEKTENEHTRKKTYSG